MYFQNEIAPLVKKLTAKEQPVFVCRREEDPAEKRSALIREIGYDRVHITFPETKGPTEIGIRLVRDLCGTLTLGDTTEDDPENLLLVGDINLDGSDIRVSATISLKDFTGTANVVLREKDEVS
ncbi:hypothetical protein [Roseibium sp. RKSG952]|uniref:hypothetical protein n=1 Tax=Roseibium sp. RKSG952 TaxID=2529384 RepID=UPI0012BBFCA7|nr:hypothetical protein [Roseibium sp. RKSG952]MTH94742.1 hypothetical protein [Roseibium sp. RKSG952]